jgi:hypothetical protein
MDLAELNGLRHLDLTAIDVDRRVSWWARPMRARTIVASALFVVLLVGVASSVSARAASTADGYRRITVKEAGISMLVPRGWKVHRGKGQNGWFSAIDASQRLVSVGPSPAYGSSLPSPADVRAYLANLARQTGGPFASVAVKRTTVAKNPAVVQVLVVSEKGPKVMTYLFQAPSGRVIAVGFGGRPAIHDDPEFDEMSNTIIHSVKLVPS